MSPELIATVVIALLGAPALSALVLGWQNRNHTQAEIQQIGAQTLQALDPIVGNWMERMQGEIDSLREEVALLTAINARLLQHLEDNNIDPPPPFI